MYNEHYYVWDTSLGTTLHSICSEQGAKRATKHIKMGHRQVPRQFETIIGGDRVALGLSTGNLSLSSPVLEGKMERKTGKIIKKNENGGRHGGEIVDHGKSMVENGGEVF